MPRREPYFEDKSLVGYWKFDDVNGVIAPDSSRFRNNGTIFGATLNPASRGLQFDGVDDYVNAGNELTTQIGTNATLMAWVNFTQTGVQTLLSKDIGSGNNLKWFWYYGTSRMSFQFNNPASVGHELLDSVWTSTQKTWHHVSLTKSGRNFTFYRDGVPTASVEADADVPEVAFALHIGEMESAMRFSGSMDEVRIWNRALSASEILNYYNKTKHKYMEK